MSPSQAPSAGPPGFQARGAGRVPSRGPGRFALSGLLAARRAPGARRAVRAYMKSNHWVTMWREGGWLRTTFEVWAV